MTETSRAKFLPTGFADASGEDADHEVPFWQRKTLHQMTDEEWESLCDGCGRCCLHRLEDADSGEVIATEFACAFFDAKSCRCSDYEHREENVSSCHRLTPVLAESLDWLPSTCAYRVLAHGGDLAWWHPLVSGDPETVHSAGISLLNESITVVGDEELEFLLSLQFGAEPDS